jgi:hypothetical protein
LAAQHDTPVNHRELGFHRSTLVEHYLTRGDWVMHLDIAPPRQPSHATAWQRIDVLDEAALKHAIDMFDPQIVLHVTAADGRSTCHITV